MKSGKEKIKQDLINELIRNKAFWSYKDVRPEQIDDDILIEKVLIHLDLHDINKLFHILPFNKIKETWEKNLLIQDPIYRSLNIFLASLYFNIKQPEKYIDKIRKDHIHSLD